VEEPRQDRGDVSHREHLGHLADARQTNPPVPKWRHDFRTLLDHLRSHLPAIGGALRELELAVKEPEEARVTEFRPGPLPVEIG
jgi:hypothetical protein